MEIVSRVLGGGNSIKDFMDPEYIDNIPLVLLPKKLNPFMDDDVEIFASLAYDNPCQNIKLLPAWKMIEAAREQGKLEGVHTIVASSSGNFVSSLAIIKDCFGIENLIAVVPADVPTTRRDLLRLYGAKEELVSDPMAKAKEYEGRLGYLHLNQYDNPANPQATEKYYAPIIWNQTDGKITVWCSGLGTGGTTIGMNRFLKSKGKVIIVGVNLLPGNAVPGVRTMERLKEVSLPWKQHLDYRAEVEARESYRRSWELINYAGICAGPSSGFALAGLLQFLGAQKAEKKLNDFRNEDEKVVAVFCCPDPPQLYLEKYFTHLESKDFSKG